jgi:hypothetical protein
MATNCPDNSNNGSGPRIYFDSLIINKEYIIKQLELYTPYYGPQEGYYNYFYVKLVEKTASTAKFELFCSKDGGGSWSENEVLEPNGADAFINYTKELIDNEDMTEDGTTAQVYAAEEMPQPQPQQPSPNSSIYGTNSNNTGILISGGRRRRTNKRKSRRRNRRRSRRR